MPSGSEAPFSPIALIQSRNAEYDNAWAKTGRLAQLVAKELTELLWANPEYFWPWISILCKLVRLLGTPTHLDSWKDISGYAQLVINDLEHTKDR